jgi:magnesium transporter
MITIFVKTPQGLVRHDGGHDLSIPAEATWIDLSAPTRAEEKAVEAVVGIDIPTREEMQEIETSSRLRQEGEALYMTVQLVANMTTPQPLTTAVTFILTKGRLVTLRYADPLPFKLFGSYAETHHAACVSGEAALSGLLEAVIDRLADVLEMAGQDVEAISHEIFDQSNTRRGSRAFRAILQRIGRAGDIAAKARESVMSLNRTVTFLGLVAPDLGGKKKASHLKTMARDLQSLADYAQFISGKVTFLLDATLGMLSIEQNDIIKIFTIAAVIFLPPTLVGTIYGMNFKFMPELDWPLGYPLALLLMVVSGVIPWVYFKRKKWI